MIFLKRVDFSNFYIKRIANGILKFLKAELFDEIFDIINQKNIAYNDISVLEDAIRATKIYYEYGYFKSTSGKFTNAIAKELENLGAVYTKSGYKLAQNQLPVNIIQAIDLVKIQTSTRLALLLKYLDTVTIDEKFLSTYIEKVVEAGFKNLEQSILDSAKEKKVPVIELGLKEVQTDDEALERYLNYFEERSKGLTELREKITALKDELELVDVKELDKAIKENRTPKDTEEQKTALKSELEQAKKDLREYEKETQKNAPEQPKFVGDETSTEIAQNYTYNMKFWVQKWSKNEITKMRKDVMGFMQKGIRRDTVQKYFEKEWKIASDKARFLARNECGLATTAIQLAQYKKLGATHFKWLRSTSKEKRELHKTYYGKVFPIDKPPIIDEETGERGYPKQIYNCSCGMSPAIPTNVKNSFLRRIKNAFTKDYYKYRRYK